jgi:5-methyltetrahydropteroyltriglutamate--homocysteine methyltransferase
VSGEETVAQARVARKPPRAEVVGSLIRPKRLQALLNDLYPDAAREHRSPVPKERVESAELRQLQDEAIREVVRGQIDAGLDVLTDGEFRRFCFDTALWDAVTGLAADPTPQVYRNSEGAAAEWGAFLIEERLEKVASPAADEAEFLASITDHPFKITFPAGSYELLDYGMQGAEKYGEGAYRNSEEALDHILSIKQQLVREAIEAGARYVQFDYAFYPHLVDRRWTEAYESAGLSPEWLLDKAIEMDKAMIDSIPDHVHISTHMCRGNIEDKWLAEGSLEPVAERVFASLPYDAFLMEWDDPRRQGGFETLRHMKGDGRVVLGLVSTKSPELESEDDLMGRIEEASKYLSVDQLALSTQCGFASSMGFNPISEDTQWRKLELIARVADRVWG